jgi:hydroxyacylglutathione hydrolase
MMNLIALPALADNYIWMLHDGAQALVVDPGDAASVHAVLDELALTLAGILVTHHHPDHVGGVNDLRPRLQGPVFGPAREHIPKPCTPLQGGDAIEVLGLHLRVLDMPGHTTGHIAYQQQPAAAQGSLTAPWLLCGDTLFSAGCGGLFEGTPTLPSTIGLERHCAATEVVASALAQVAVGGEPLAVFTALREWKNRFR